MTIADRFSFRRALARFRRFSQPPDVVVSHSTQARYRQITLARRQEFVNQGLPASLVFPHRVFYLPKYGPDGHMLATRMCGDHDPNDAWEVVLYADGAAVERVPRDLFFDDDIIWHQQQFGRVGQVATANLLIRGEQLYSTVHVSDLVQRIGRRREFKTSVEKGFKGWTYMLLNASMNFAIERGLRTMRTPTSTLALRHTDRRRNPAKEMFERIYDRAIAHRFRAEQDGDWWVIDVAANRDRVVVPEAGVESIPMEKTICICHDVERGLGHLDVDPTFAQRADQTSPQSLATMLEIEAEAGVTATYSVVGSILNEERGKIDGRGHALAFHSYDHDVADGRQSLEQVSRCRGVDYRIKGYRPPQSKLTEDTEATNLLHHNFEWLASSSSSLRHSQPALAQRLVWIPIAFDDFPLYNARMAYEKWERTTLDLIAKSAFVAIGLHDCYGPFWLPHYRALLQKLKGLGVLTTFDQVATDVTFRAAG